MKYSMTPEQLTPAPASVVRGKKIAVVAGSLLALTGCTPTYNGAEREPLQPNELPVECARQGLQPDIQGHSQEAVRAAVQAAIYVVEGSPAWDHKSTMGSGGYNFMTPIKTDDGKRVDASKLPPAVQYRYIEDLIENNLENGADWRQAALTLISPTGANKMTPCNSGVFNTYADHVVVLTDQFLDDPSQIPDVPGLPKSEYNPEG